MSEHSAIEQTSTPVTTASLCRQLGDAGVVEGTTLLVHTSLSSMGWVAGGPVAVIEALIETVGACGTIVMPTHTMQLTDPASWQAPAIPTPWIPVLREHLPAFDPAKTPTRSMGAVAELFRTWPDARRSSHPIASFAAVGSQADWITADHKLHSPLGEASPLAKLYEADATILLLGVGFDRCTMLHLAEQRAWPGQPTINEGSPVLRQGTRQWVNYAVPDLIDSRHFIPIGAALTKHGEARSFMAGQAAGTLVSSRMLVDFAVQTWAGQPRPAH